MKHPTHSLRKDTTMSMSAIHVEVTCQSYTASAPNVPNGIAKAVEECTKQADEDLRHMQQKLKLTVKILTTTTQIVCTERVVTYIITLTMETKG